MAVKSSQKMKTTIKIPLDYYRILSVPVTATESQLQQAYEDRLQQKPRKEYGSDAIAARQQLIESAYRLLGDPQKRAEYNSQFFGDFYPEPQLLEKRTTDAQTTTVAPPSAEPTITNPAIAIPLEQMSGALLILQELGEYELVLKLGINYLNSAEYAERQQHQERRSALAEREDIILSLALAYLELGREEWQRREYERAAMSGHRGLEILSKENLFPKVKQELEIDLYRLQPYRILESISQYPVNSPQRNKGLQLLADLLRQRQGIEGRESDRNSPGFERFLCFIQQIRTHLTSAEQEALFITEARYASDIGNYLAVYALLARGYALKQPASIARAQRLLQGLSQRQDVYWELAICSLLLGLSDRVLALVAKSSDRSKIELIRQNCKGSDDLFVGLYVSAGEWLRQEVLHQFCDLANHPISLQEYFEDPQVQNALEKLAPVATDKPKKATPQPPQAKAAAPSKRTSFFSRWRKKPKSQAKSSPSRPRQSQPFPNPVANHGKPPTKATVSSNSSGVRNGHRPLRTSVAKKAVAPSTRDNPQHFSATRRTNSAGDRRRYLKRGWLMLLFILGLILGVGTLSFATMRLFLNRTPQIAETEPQLFISLDRPLLQLPPVQAVDNPPQPQPQPTFTDEARQVVQRWLDSKSAAFGADHQVERLNEVLIGSLLTSWRDRALSYQANNTHREYDRQVAIESAEIDPDNPQRATIIANVKEVARHYQQGKLDEAQSYDDDLLVRYKLVRQGDKWMIAGSELLEIN